jgi:hypothetical protein
MKIEIETPEYPGLVITYQPRPSARLKSWLLWQIAGLSNWLAEHCVTSSPEICWQDHLRWFLEGLLSSAHSLLYPGSVCEVTDIREVIISPRWRECCTPIQYQILSALEYRSNPPHHPQLALPRK